MKNMLVCLDFSKVSKALIDHAENLANCTGAKIWLLHVAAPEPDFVGYEVGPQYIRDEVATNLREERRKIQAWAKDLRNKGLEAEALLIQGPTVDSIVNKARDVNADLIVIASKSHGFLYESLIGSTFREVLSQSKVPLYVIPNVVQGES